MDPGRPSGPVPVKQTRRASPADELAHGTPAATAREDLAQRAPRHPEMVAQHAGRDGAQVERRPQVASLEPRWRGKRAVNPR